MFGAQNSLGERTGVAEQRLVLKVLKDLLCRIVEKNELKWVENSMVCTKCSVHTSPLIPFSPSFFSLSSSSSAS